MRRKTVEDVCLLTNLDVVGIREGAIRVRLASIESEEPDDAFALRRNRPEHQGVDDREGGAVGADAKSEDHDRHDGEAGGLGKRADRVAKILQKL